MSGLEEISTGVPSLDDILGGGLPRNSVNVIAGPPGSGKTILAQQIVFQNAHEDKRAPYLVTVSEPTMKMLRYNQQLSFFDANRVGTNVIYLDIGSTLLEGGLTKVAEQIEEYIERYQPMLLAIDSFKALHEVAQDAPTLREFGYRLAVRLTTWGTTSLLVGEYTREAINEAPIFAIADGIILLDQAPRGMQTERYLEVIKMRGDGYFSGRHPLSISSDGIQVYPRVTTPNVTVPYTVGERRVSLGVPDDPGRCPVRHQHFGGRQRRYRQDPAGVALSPGGRSPGRARPHGHLPGDALHAAGLQPRLRLGRGKARGGRDAAPAL